MKEYFIKDGGKKYQLAENADDLNIVRYSALKNIISEGSAGMKIPDMLQWFANRRSFYNQQDYYSLLTDEINMARSVEENSKSIFNEASHRIFSLMVLEEDEKPGEVDTTKLDEKLSRMSAEGLTQGEVWNVVEGFINASPRLSASFFLMSLVALSKQLNFSEQQLASIVDMRKQAESLVE